jgi:hypothetical protein
MWRNEAMRRITGSLAAAMTMALAMGAIGTPVAAAEDAMMVFVQGLPGKNVELCVKGVELKSNMQYGGKLKKKYGAGTYNVAFRQKAAGVCKGNKIVARSVTLTAGESVTLVAGMKGTGPTIRFFNNNPFLPSSTPAAIYAAFVVSHAAMIGALDGHIAQVITPTAAIPTFPNIKQGKQEFLYVEEGNFSIWLTKKGQSQILFGPVVKPSAMSKTNHYVAIGTTQQNFKLVFFQTPFPIF